LGRRRTRFCDGWLCVRRATQSRKAIEYCKIESWHYSNCAAFQSRPRVEISAKDATVIMEEAENASDSESDFIVELIQNMVKAAEAERGCLQALKEASKPTPVQSRIFDLDDIKINLAGAYLIQ
jgi:hypothetical protein